MNHAGINTGPAERSWGPVRLLPGPNQGRYPNCHTLYIPGDKILIDTGVGRERLLALREQEGVDQVWLSHWHRDHIRHLDLFGDVPLFMAPEDAPPLADTETFLNWSGVVQDQYRDHWREDLKRQFHFRPRRPDGLLREGQKIRLRSGSVTVIAAPGHTPGSLCFLFQPGAVLFLADYDLTPFGPWYGDPHSDMDQITNTVERLNGVEASVWLTSHGRGVFEENPGALWAQYVSVFQRRDEQILRLLKAPRSMPEIVDAWIAYGQPREPGYFYRSAEEAIMRKHLQRLTARGLVVRRGGRYQLK